VFAVLEQCHGTLNCQTVFGMKKIPTDNYIRLMFDPVCPEAFEPRFDQVIVSATADANTMA
jgi:hypothetical protein